MRLLAAGRAEFARRGLAGARTNIAALLDQVPFDATDLGGYAVVCFDQLLADPAALRLTLWRSVEGGPAL